MEVLTMKELEQFLRTKNIRPSFLRLKVLEYFFKHHNHPSVNMIYENLIDKIPTLSKTSVYNTLGLFVEHNIIEEVGVSDNEQRYDLYRTKTHAHFYCEQCKEITDINFDIDDKISEIFSEYEVQNQSIQFRGICPNCLKKK